MTDVAAVQRWVRRAQSAHRERGETLGNLYLALLFVLIVGGMLHRQVEAAFWPDMPNLSRLAACSLAVTLTGGLHLMLRRLGPLGLSRPAASWLLTAPVSRRRLLLPSLWLATVAAAAAGALGTLAITAHAVARPVPSATQAVLPVAGVLLGAGLVVGALATQAARRSSWPDDAAYLLVAAGLAGLVADSAVVAPHAPAGWPPADVVGLVAAALAVVVIPLFLLAVRGLARTPNDRILEASRTTGTLVDSVYGGEPSFVTEMVERRYWAGRRLRSRPLPARIPVLVAQDLLLARRRPRRLLWLAGGAALPTLLGDAPGWASALAVLAGGMIAGGVTTANVRTDAGNPWMLRMLGLSSRAAVRQRLVVPSVLAALWCAATLAVLSALGDLPPGPWWVLGLSLGPVGGIAAVRTARTGFVDNSLLPLDTPMGTLATGPLIAAFAGLDALILGVPAIVQMAQGDELSWTAVLLQAGLAALGVRIYLSGTTKTGRVELKAP